MCPRRTNADRAMRIRCLEDENTHLQMEIINIRHEKSIVVEELRREKERANKIRNNVSLDVGSLSKRLSTEVICCRTNSRKSSRLSTYSSLPSHRSPNLDLSYHPHPRRHHHAAQTPNHPLPQTRLMAGQQTRGPGQEVWNRLPKRSRSRPG